MSILSYLNSHFLYAKFMFFSARISLQKSHKFTDKSSESVFDELPEQIDDLRPSPREQDEQPFAPFVSLVTAKLFSSGCLVIIHIQKRKTSAVQPPPWGGCGFLRYDFVVRV